MKYASKFFLFFPPHFRMTLVEIEAARNASNPTPLCNVTGNRVGSNSSETPVKPSRAMIHPCVDPPLCADCTRLELSFFDPLCPGCRKLMEDPATSVPDIFAIMRQWTPQTQQAMEMLVDEVREWHYFLLPPFFLIYILCLMRGAR